MSLAGSRRRKKSRKYEILIIPKGDGSGTKSIAADGLRFALWGGAAFLVFFLIFLLVFRFTPLGVLVGLEMGGEDARRREREETQRRIESLASELAVLKDYNVQLRKALGDKANANESATADSPQEPVKETQQPQQEVLEDFSSPLATPVVAAVSSEGLKASFPLLAPVDGVITQGFLPNERHFGVDYAAKEGTTVHASAQGYVVFAGWTYEDGNVLILSHGDGYITVYKHNSSLLKPTGTMVRRGEPISLVGTTGVTSKGPHLHFEVMKDGVPEDPLQFLLNSKSAL